jgi:addiction module RelB/DinJ family antitoxin
MSTANATIQIRIDSKTKAKAQATLKKLGLDISSATKLFLNKVIKTKSIPFIVRTVNGYTPEFEAEMLAELKAMRAGHEKTFKTAKEFMASLEQE